MVFPRLLSECLENGVHHRDTEDTEGAQRKSYNSLCVLCALCVSVVNNSFHTFNCNPL
jgi:hypothetical protein